jgi:hypothetical protein
LQAICLLLKTVEFRSNLDVSLHQISINSSVFNQQFPATTPKTVHFPASPADLLPFSHPFLQEKGLNFKIEKTKSPRLGQGKHTKISLLVCITRFGCYFFPLCRG